MASRISENPMIDYKNLAWVGLNSPVTLDQFDPKRNHNLKMTTAQNSRDLGIVAIMNDAMETASDGVDAVYVSIDIDVIDAYESTGTGSPEFHGVTTNEFFEAMDMHTKFDMLGAFDLCEVSPEWDPSGQTVRIATSGILKILAPILLETVDPDDLLNRS
jgi:arginase family enzyme